jgi:hypothetical protein
MTTQPETPRPSRPWRRRFVKLAVALVWVPVSAELFLRWLAPVPLMPRYVVASPLGVRVNRPGVVYYHTTPEVRVRMAINAQGIRADRDIPYARPPGVQRIVVLGDSFGMGYEVALEDMFLSVMERDLAAAGVPAEVVNLSVSGHGNAEQLLLLRGEGFRYQPNLVLVAWHRTDLEDNARSKLFRLDGDELLRDQPRYLPGTAIQERLMRHGLYRWLSEHSQLYAFTMELVSERVKGVLTRLRRNGPAAGAGRPPSAEKPDAGLTPNERLAVALLRQMQREARAHGAEFLVVDIPIARGSVYRSEFPIDPAGRDFGLRVVRPVERFNQLGNVLLYWKRGHFHLTPAACRVVGWMLARAILDARLLAGPATGPTP